MKLNTNLTNRTFIIAGILLLILLNEFTLVYVDPMPPLGDRALLAIRTLDICLVMMILFGKWLMENSINALIVFSKGFSTYIIPSLLTVIILDIALRFLGFGLPNDYSQENIERYPSPADGFTGKPNVLDYNQFGFRGEFIQNKDAIAIALFGGSTGHNGEPTIIETVKEQLQDQNLKIDIFNFSSVSSNHTQHVHRLLKYHDKFNFDMVIFYGGGNETLQYVLYDPRGGYPYNFFFRNELPAIKQSILRYSSILGEVDRHTGIISGKNKLQATTKGEGWQEKIVDKYWRDLKVAKDIATKISRPNVCKQAMFVSINQPGAPFDEEMMSIWDKLKNSVQHQNQDWYHYDFSKYEKDVEFNDIIHITQPSRDFLGRQMADVVYDILNQNCSKL